MGMAEQLAVVDEDLGQRLETDFRLVMPGASSAFQYIFRDEGRYEAYTDEWGIGWRKPVDGGFYYDMYHHPLAGATSLDDFKRYPVPDPLDEQRFATLREQAEDVRARGKVAVLAGPSAGIAEIYSWLRGYEG